MNFTDRLIGAILAKKSYLCVGLDPQLRYFPPHLLKYWGQSESGSVFNICAEAILDFNKTIINATIESAPCYKPQRAFYEKYGSPGIRAFELTVKYIHAEGALAIEDAKREDGGDTAEAYADGHLGKVEIITPQGELALTTSPNDVDAMTVTNWIDGPMLDPFVKVVKDNDKGIFVVVKTSFKPESRYQEMMDANGVKSWVKMANAIAELGKDVIGERGYSSIGVVMGATYPDEAEMMRNLVPMAFKLVPGFGFQGAGPNDAVVSINSDGLGIIVNNSRGTNYAWHPKFKSEFQCDPRYYANAAARESEKARKALNDAVKKKNGFLPWE
ncbi:MAG: orotidine-5'-phosphate decarboxylase [Patescibacteria group bacterium]